jgi:hypothetical protein
MSGDSMTDSIAQDLIRRLADVAERLEVLATQPGRHGLTAPDKATGERWDEGQVWAHMAEFPHFWLGEAHRLLKSGRAELLEFGRGDTSRIRLEGIRSRRYIKPIVLFRQQIRPSIREVQIFLENRRAEELQIEGLHVEDGVMSILRLIEDYVVDHLEEHAEQVDSIETVAPST